MVYVMVGLMALLEAIGLDSITGFIATVGFPIAAYAAMFFYMIKQSNLHKEETVKMIEALNNNTVAINELKEELFRRND